MIEQRRLRAVEEARVAASNSVSESRRELENRLMAMEERAAAAETLARAAEAEARAARAEEEKAIGEREEYLARVSVPYPLSLYQPPAPRSSQPLPGVLWFSAVPFG